MLIVSIIPIREIVLRIISFICCCSFALLCTDTENIRNSYILLPQTSIKGYCSGKKFPSMDKASVYIS